MSWKVRVRIALAGLMLVAVSLSSVPRPLEASGPLTPAAQFAEDSLPLGDRFGFIGNLHLPADPAAFYLTAARKPEPQPVNYVRLGSLRNGSATDTDSPSKVTVVPDNSYWIIGNEPNAFSTSGQQVSAEDYAKLTHDWYVRLKGPNPPGNSTAKVFVGQTAYADTTFLDQWWTAYNSKYGAPQFDGYTVHANTMPRSDTTYGPYNNWTVPNAVNTMREWMRQKGLSSKPLWLTEYGVTEGFDNQYNIEWAKIRDYMRTTNQWLIANTDKVQRWFWFADVTTVPDWTGTQDACWTGNLYHVNETADCFSNGVNDGTLTPLGSEYLAEIRGLNGSAPKAYLPVAMKNAYGGWTTRVHIRNNGSSAGLVTVMYYDELGKSVSSDMQIVPAGGTWVVSQGDNIYLNDGFAGSAVVSSPQPVVATVNEIPPSGDGMSYDGASGGSTVVHLPVVMKDAYGGWNTGIGLVNVGNSAARVVITYYDTNGNPIGAGDVMNSLASKAYWGVYQGSSPLPAGFAGSAVISSTQPIVAIVNEINGAARGGGAMSYLGVPQGTTRTTLPAVMNNAYGGWTTGLGVRNVTTTTAAVTVTYYDNAGALSGTEQKNLSPGGYWGTYQGSGILPNGFAGSAVVSSTQPVVAIANEVNYVSNGAMSYAGFGQGGTVIYLPAIFKEHVLPGSFASFGSWTTGVSIKNLGVSAATVEIDYYNSSGALVSKKNQQVGASGYWGVYQGDWMQGLPSGFEGSAIIRSAQPLVAIVNQVSQSGSSLSYEGIVGP